MILLLLSLMLDLPFSLMLMLDVHFGRCFSSCRCAVAVLLMKMKMEDGVTLFLLRMEGWRDTVPDEDGGRCDGARDEDG